MTRTGNERGTRTEKSAKPDSFAESMLGMDRTEREENPGREIRKNADRGGKRPDESDSSQSSASGETKAKSRSLDEGRRKPKAKSESEAPANDAREMSVRQPVETVRGEKPKADLPSFFTDGTDVAGTGKNPGGKGAAVAGAGVAGAVTAKKLAGSATGGISQAQQETLSMLQGMQAQEATASQKAIVEFVEKMKSEMGVPAEQLLQAFSQMSPEDLKAAPEVSMESFLSKLKLQPGDKARAAELYGTMVKDTGDAALSQQLAGMGDDVKMQVSGPRDTALKKLSTALDDMNDSFFMRGEHAVQNSSGANAMDAGPVLDPSAKAQMAADELEAKLAALMRTNDGSDMRAIGAGAGLGAGAALASEGAELESLAVEGREAWDGATAMSGDAMPFADADLMDALDLGSESGMSFGERLAEQGGKSQVAASQAGAANASQFQQELKSETKQSAKKSASGEGESLKGDLSASSSLAPVAGAPAPNANAKTAAAGAAGFMVGGRVIPTQAEEQENIRELVRQAQVVLKKGGGEMNLELKPEGIGQVKLKVSVDDGNVSVQMLAENDHSKRLLEKSLHELKANLAAQDLQVGSMKVDIGGEIQKHMDQEAAREQSQKMAQHMMGQFREERESMRQGFMENPGWKSYGRGTRRENVSAESVTSAGVASSAGAARRAAAGRLNLVA